MTKKRDRAERGRGGIKSSNWIFIKMIVSPHADKPAPPSNISGVLLGSSTSVLVSWLPPINDGHSPIINYILEARQLEDNDWISVSSRVEAAAHVVEDLLPGKSYLFRVASMNVIGASQFSKPSSPILITNDEGRVCVCYYST